MSDIKTLMMIKSHTTKFDNNINISFKIFSFKVINSFELRKIINFKKLKLLLKFKMPHGHGFFGHHHHHNHHHHCPVSLFTTLLDFLIRILFYLFLSHRFYLHL